MPKLNLNKVCKFLIDHGLTLRQFKKLIKNFKNLAKDFG